ncbi:uncharacterized protein LOC136029732 [Artemia franciscana]|uniref:uncharacterized protein LOC136029732 n=1 Tax=Artemia franciscana TaxID=6661 RepID=UPI0032DA02C7
MALRKLTTWHVPGAMARWQKGKLTNVFEVFEKELARLVKPSRGALWFLRASITLRIWVLAKTSNSTLCGSFGTVRGKVSGGYDGDGYQIHRRFLGIELTARTQSYRLLISLNVLANITTGTEEQIEAVVAADLLKYFPTFYLLTFHAQKNISSAFTYLVSVHSLSMLDWCGILDSGCVDRLEINQKRAPRIICRQGKKALNVLTNVTASTEKQIEAVVAADLLKYFLTLLVHGKKKIIKEALCILYNVIVGSENQVETLIDEKLFKYFPSLLEKGVIKIQVEAAKIVTALARKNREHQTAALIEAGVVMPFCRLLNVKNSKVIQLVLDGINSLLNSTPPGRKRNFVCTQIDKCGGKTMYIASKILATTNTTAITNYSPKHQAARGRHSYACFYSIPIYSKPPSLQPLRKFSFPLNLSHKT